MPVVQNQNRFLERAFWGLLRKRLPDGEPVIVAGEKGIRSYSIGMEGVYFVEAGSQMLQSCRYRDSKVTGVAKLPEGVSLPGQFAVSPDGKNLASARVEQTISDLYLVEGVR